MLDTGLSHALSVFVTHTVVAAIGRRTFTSQEAIFAAQVSLNHPRRSFPLASPQILMSIRSSHLDTVTVIADEQSQAVFDIPRQHLSELLETQDPETVVVHDRDTEAAKSVTGIFIRKVDFASFYDFVQWTKNSRILQYPHENAEWLVEHHARRLVDALALGVNIKSTEYQCAAVSELHTLGPLLTWPEDLVNIIFAATSAYSPGDHPARQLIVAIVAAKTCGAGKRKARQGARDRNVERGDRISSTTFWKMYDAYCMEQGPECPYPERS